MTDTEKRLAARQFAAHWAGHGDEKQQTQVFWLGLLRNVFGVPDAESRILFEEPVKVDDLRTGRTTTKFIDAYIPETKVLIEQKSLDVDLSQGEVQSDGSRLRPYQQARRYGGYMGKDRQPRWIVVCNFQQFHIHDMNRPNDEPEVLALADLEREVHRLRFLVDETDENIRREEAVSKEAGAIVGVLYDALLKQYNSTPPLPLQMSCVL